MLSVERASRRLDEFSPQVRLLIALAERELSAFMSAVDSQFGVEQAHRSALDWIEEMSLIQWPVNGSMPPWRKATLGASIRLGKSVPGDPRAMESPIIHREV